MSWWHGHPDAHALVKAHWKEAELFIVASTEPCIRIRDEEVAILDRVVRGGIPKDLLAWKRPRSWFVAVILCHGDSTDDLAKLVADEGLDPRRFHFYLHPDTSRKALSAWAAAGLPLDHVDEGVKDWKRLHKLLGVDFNVQIVEDFLAEPPKDG